jgi:hypothetical protein
MDRNFTYSIDAKILTSFKALAFSLSPSEPILTYKQTRLDLKSFMKYNLVRGRRVFLFWTLVVEIGPETATNS